MSQRHLWLRSSQQHAILQGALARSSSAIARLLLRARLLRVDSPILTPAACEGTSTLFETQYTEDEKAYLSQSGQLYLEPAAAAFGKVYCFGPTFRAEKSKTRRHLREFWMVEPEVAFIEIDGLLDLAEEFVVRSRRPARSTAAREDLKRLERDTAKLETVSRSRFRASPTATRSRCCRRRAFPVKFGDDLGGDEETALARRLRPAGHGHALPGLDQGVLHAARPEGPGRRALPRHARAGGLRRDHRRLAAHPRP